MSELLDLVARAIWAKRCELARLKGIELEDWGDGSIPIANHIHSEALAAISVMRHPTEIMHKAAIDFSDPGGDIALRDLDGVFTAMIDAGLEER